MATSCDECGIDLDEDEWLICEYDDMHLCENCAPKHDDHMTAVHAHRLAIFGRNGVNDT
jgi:hypothetical protein